MPSFSSSFQFSFLLFSIFFFNLVFSFCSVVTKIVGGERIRPFGGRNMVHLFLLEPPAGDVGNDNAAQKRISLLQELESIIWSVITSGGRSEARLWLCTTISCITSITPHDQCELFVNLLRSKPPKRSVATRLVQLIFEKRPQKVGPIISKKSHMLEKFFEGKSSNSIH